MKVLVLGASSATGRLVVRQLIKRTIPTRIMHELVRDCSVIVSCLGHNISFKGIFGIPRNLVYDAVRRISTVAERSADSGNKPRLILMSTTAYTIEAADYLIQETATNKDGLEWVAARPATPRARNAVVSFHDVRW